MGMLVVAPLRRERLRSSNGDNNVRLKLYELCGQHLQRFPGSVTIVNLEILSFHIAELAK
jgi:hypothetical protein